MRCHEDLAFTSSGIFGELLRKRCQEGWIKLILWLLNAQQRMRLRVVQQGEIGKHLDRAVRHRSCDEILFEGFVAKAEGHASVSCVRCQDVGDARHEEGHFANNGFVDSCMLFTQVLRVKRNVAAPFVQVLRNGRVGFDSGILYVKITDNPVSINSRS